METCRLCGTEIPGPREALIEHVKATHVTDGGAVDARTRPSRHLSSVNDIDRPALCVVDELLEPFLQRFDPLHPVFHGDREPDPTPAA